MTLSFFSNFLNHHQLPLCQEFIGLVGKDNFHFIATDKITDERLSLGYEDMNEIYPFVVKDYNGEDFSAKSRRLALDSDIAIFTQSAFHYCEDRLKMNKITFLYIERQFKRGLISLFHPRVFKRYFSYIKYRNKPLYILCAGAFVANDMTLFGFPRNKCFKWGYFPAVQNIDISSILKRKEKQVFKMMWCGRFIDWKRPELSIRLAKDLKRKGYHFILEMYGNGILLDKIKKMVNEYDLNDVVKIYGSVSNEQVLVSLQSNNLLLFTSNKREGWGAIANEAMANGCVLVASDQVGAVPYLIEDGFNGSIFKSNNYMSLLSSVEELLLDKELVKVYSERSYEKIQSVWSASTAARNLIVLSNSLMRGNEVTIKQGPCSYA